MFAGFAPQQRLLPPNPGVAASVNLTNNGFGVLSWVAPGGASLTIGTTAVSGGTAQKMLFVGPAGTLLQQSGMTWTEGTNTLQIPDGGHINVSGTTTGLLIGATTSDKVAFVGGTPAAQQANSVDLGTVLSNFGFRASGGNPPLNLGTGAITCGTIAAGGTITMGDTFNIAVNTGTGTKIGTATTQKLGFYNATPVVQQTGDLITGLSNLGLIASGSISEADVTNLTTDLAAKAPLASPSFTGTTFTLADADNIVLGTSSGTKIGTATTQKIGFFNSAPVVQQTGDLVTALSNLGLVVTGSVAASDFGTQTANFILAGPTSGSAATPTFRAAVYADQPIALPKIDFAVYSLCGGV